MKFCLLPITYIMCCLSDRTCRRPAQADAPTLFAQVRPATRVDGQAMLKRAQKYLSSRWAMARWVMLFRVTA